MTEQNVPAPDPAPDDVDDDADLLLQTPVAPTVDESLIGRKPSQDPEVPA